LDLGFSVFFLDDSVFFYSDDEAKHDGTTSSKLSIHDQFGKEDMVPERGWEDHVHTTYDHHCQNEKKVFIFLFIGCLSIFVVVVIFELDDTAVDFVVVVYVVDSDDVL
jgi:hypothetical protein